MIKRFLNEIIIFLLVSGISRLLPFLLTPVFTHYISPTEMGRLEIILSSYNILIVLGMCQIDTAVQRFYYERESISKAAIFTVAKLSSIIALITIVASPLLMYFYFKNEMLIPDVMITAASIVFGNMFIINGLIVRYSKPIRYIAILNLTQTILFVVCAYYGVVVLHMGIRAYLLAMLISYILSSILSLIFIKDKISLKFSCVDTNKLWGFALPQLPARVASALSQYGNRFLLLWIFNQSIVGVFAIANKISSLMLVGLTAFCMVWYPMLYSKENRNNIEIRKLFKLVIVLLIPLIPVMLIITHVIFKFYVAEQYFEAEYVSYVLIVATSLLVIKEMVDSGIKLSGKVKFISYIYILNTIFLFVAMFLAGKEWGIIGVSYAILISNVILIFMTWIVSEKCYAIGFSVNYFILYMLYCMTIVALIIYVMPSVEIG